MAALRAPALLLLPLAALSCPAIAQTDAPVERRPVLAPYPALVIGTLIELESDATLSSSDPDAEFTDSYVTVTTDVALEVEPGSGLFGVFIFEPVFDATDTRWPFEDHGLYIEQIFARWDAGPAALRAGKFNVRFGSAFDEAPGLYGADFAEDYQLTERLGVDVSVPIATDAGDHELFAALFTADRTPLSGSVFTERGRLRAEDGGPSNTGTLNSGAVGVQGLLGNLSYTVGLEHQAKGEGDASAETGVVLGAWLPVAIGDDELGFFGEIARFEGYQGADQQATYPTVGVSYGFGEWTLSGVYAGRYVSDGGDTDHLLSAGVDYALADGVGLATAYRWGDEGGVRSHTVGVYLSVAFGFASFD